MAFLTELWLPILLAAVFVFIVSSVIHMKNEVAVLEAMRANGVEPGAYMFTCAASMKGMGSPEMVVKLKKGPVGWLTVAPPGGFKIAKSLVWWLVFALIVGVLVAYVGGHGLGAGAGYLDVFQITGAAAVLGYSIGHFHDSVWNGASWGTTAKFIFDGVAYALVTAGTFGWLWPDAV